MHEAGKRHSGDGQISVDFALNLVLKRQRARPPSASPSRREAGAGIEPANRGFADPDLTTWLPRRSGR